jgi:hypothetical protein
MMGFATRDRAKGCEGVHDDLFVRALYLEHAGEAALVMGFDLCFLGREDADRLKGAIGRRIDLSPRQILLNTSHTHTGPSVGTWAYGDHTPPDRLYLRELEAATVSAACQARDSMRDATLRAGKTRSLVPMSRRKKDEQGRVYRGMRPNPDGAVCDTLPIALFQDTAGRPICLLFSVSCHPSIIDGWQISAEYPGVAMARLDAHLGATASLFLQGTGGDAKPRMIGDLEDRWRVGDWEDVRRTGETVAQEVIAALAAGLAPVEPEIRTALVEMEWPLEPAPERAGFRQIAEDPATGELQRLWAERQVALLDRGQALLTAVPITLQGVQLGRAGTHAVGGRLVGIEGEAVAELGLLIERFYDDGVTFPLGYTNGQGLYLPTSAMMDEGGYEVVSSWEYGLPAPLARGLEDILARALEQMPMRGVRAPLDR